MNRARVGVLALLLGGLLVFSCGKKSEPTGPGEAGENYIPYQVGNTWTYQVSPTKDAPYTATETVVAQVQENGKKLAVVKDESSKNPGDFSLTYFEIQSNRLLMHRIADFDPETGDTVRFDFQTPAVWLQIPLKKGQKWTVFQYSGPVNGIPIISSAIQMDSTYAAYTVTMTLKGQVITEETVQAANSEFQAYKVEFTFEGSLNIPNPPTTLPLSGKLGTFWITPEVGIVRIMFYELTGEIREVRTLTSYSLQK